LRLHAFGAALLGMLVGIGLTYALLARMTA